jgi:hypothetical protein
MGVQDTGNRVVILRVYLVVAQVLRYSFLRPSYVRNRLHAQISIANFIVAPD